MLALPGTQRQWGTLPGRWLVSNQTRVSAIVFLCIALRMDQNHRIENIPRQPGT